MMRMTKDENDEGTTAEAPRRASQKSVATSPTREGTHALPTGVGACETFEPIAAFEEAIAFTRERSPASFDQWFSGVQFDSLVDGVLSLRARDEFVREWVDDHFMPALTDFIRAKTGWSVQVAWAIDGSLANPIADQPSSAPVRPRPLTLRPEAPTSVQLRSSSAPPPAPTSGADLPAERSSGIHPVTA